MATTTKRAPKATKQAASPMPTPAAPVVAQAPAKPAHGMPVAVRIGAQYRCAAAHNMQWWQALQAACAANGGTAPLAPLLQAAKGATAGNPGTAGAPGHFVGYALRKGYLVPAA